MEDRDIKKLQAQKPGEFTLITPNETKSFSIGHAYPICSDHGHICAYCTSKAISLSDYELDDLLGREERSLKAQLGRLAEVLTKPELTALRFTILFEFDRLLSGNPKE